MPPRWLMPRPVEFLWAPWAGGARNRPVGAPGCTCKKPVLPSLGCWVPVHPLCGHRGGPNLWSTAPATQVAYLGAALRPGGGPWAAAPVPVTAGAGWAAVWARWGLGAWLAQGAWQGATGLHWPALVGECKPPRWHQMPRIFLGPSLLPVVAETAAQNNTTVCHKSDQLPFGLGPVCAKTRRQVFECPSAHALWLHATCTPSLRGMHAPWWAQWHGPSGSANGPPMACWPRRVDRALPATTQAVCGPQGQCSGQV